MNSRERTEQNLLDMFGSRLGRYFPAKGHENPAVWISQTFEALTSAVSAGDTQAISLACELIEKDPKFPFGKLIKSGLARALKRQINKIVESERRQVLTATAHLLTLQYAPRELEDYCKLVKKFPREEMLAAINSIQPGNVKADRLFAYLQNAF